MVKELNQKKESFKTKFGKSKSKTLTNKEIN